MSKIYEALLRAEIDRIAGLEKSGSAETPAPQSVVPSPPPLNHAQAPMPLTEQVRNEPASFNAPTSGPLVDLSRVSRHVWIPSAPQLPALEAQGRAVEQFRSLRSRMHEFRDLNTLRSILVSSGLPSEGKSFVAANLAISIARHKSSRVLLIDGDMRRGTLHKLLGTRNAPGLTEFLSGKASINDVIQQPKAAEVDATVPRGFSSLSFIPCGADAENAADLSGNGLFDKLLLELYPLFDWIVIDSSPVNMVSDAVNLARSVDGVLLVTRAEVTKYETAQRALLELKASKVIGAVLNGVENPPSVGGYYGYDTYDKMVS